MAAPHVTAFAARYGNSQTTPVQREYFVRRKLTQTGYQDEAGRTIKIPRDPSTWVSVPNRLSPVDIAASSTLSGSSPDFVDDGIYSDGSRIWNAGRGAPAWIAFDFGSSRRVLAIRLVPAQYPVSGPMTHYIYTGDSFPPQNIAAVTDETTTNRHPIIRTFDKMGRFVQVRTVASSSWVAWREVELYGY
jgi:hypothetical protein